MTSTIHNYEFKPYQPIPHYVKNQRPQFTHPVQSQPEIAYIFGTTHPIRAMKFRYAHYPPCKYAIPITNDQLRQFNRQTYIYSNVTSSATKSKMDSTK